MHMNNHIYLSSFEINKSNEVTNYEINVFSVKFHIFTLLFDTTFLRSLTWVSILPGRPWADIGVNTASLLLLSKVTKWFQKERRPSRLRDT